MIHFNCPHCTKKLKAPERAASRMIACPKCGQSLVIPPPVRSPGPTLPDSAAISLKPSSVVGSAAADSSAGKVTINCPGCGRSIQLLPDELSLNLQCSRCNAIFVPTESRQTLPDSQYEFDSSDSVGVAPNEPCRPKLGMGFRLSALMLSVLVGGIFFWVIAMVVHNNRQAIGIDILGGGSKVSKAKYDKIKEGMSYAEVKQIVGSEGEEMASNKFEGVPGVMPGIATKMYMWQNPNGSNMNTMFQNDRLIQKAQFGLK